MLINSTDSKEEQYKAEFNHQAYKLCFIGADNRQLAYFFEITELELNKWKQHHQDFANSIEAGKVAAIKAWFNSDGRVSNKKVEPMTAEEIRRISKVLEEEC